MYKIQASLAIAVCVAAGGCTGQQPQAVQQTPTISKTELASASQVPPVVLSSAPLRRRTERLAHPRKHAPVRIADDITETDLAPSPEMTRQDLSALAKVIVACPAYKHGHSLELRPDLAFEETGKDCQGDLPGRAFKFR